MGDRRFLLLVLAAGIALRLVWFAAQYGAPTIFAGGGEATRVALSIARGGGIADAYFAGSGPTAHVMPAMATIAAGIFRLFGAGSGAANVALLGWSLMQVFAGYLLIHRLFRTLGAPPTTLRWGLVLLCLIPVFVPQETVDFRFWEGALATCLAVGNLILIVRWSADGIGTARATGAAALAAITAFVSPAAGLGVVACWGWFAVSQLRWTQAVRFALIGGAAFAAVFGPWAARNTAVLGEPVLTRSNFGLELAIANHSAAAAAAGDPAQVYADRMLAIHPYLSQEAQSQLRTRGEVGYARALGRSARRWITAHPADFLTLAATHLTQVFAPRAWQMYFSGWEGLRALRAAIMSVLMLIGLAGLALGVLRNLSGYTTIAIYVTVVALPYALVQPVPRYSYLIYGVLTFVAVDTLRWAGSALSARLSGPGIAR